MKATRRKGREDREVEVRAFGCYWSEGGERERERVCEWGDFEIQKGATGSNAR